MTRFRGLALVAGILALTACGGSDDDVAASAGGGGKGSGGSSAATGGKGGGSSGSSGTGGKGGGSSGTSGKGGGSSGTSGNPGDVVTYGDSHDGQYHLGVVDFDESEWHNACAPGEKYRAALRDSAGLGDELIAGVSNEYNQAGGVCDACILIETALGHSVVARVVTYGDEAEPGDIDVSQSIYDMVNEDEFPRTMTWTFAKCPDVGPMLYEFQTAANLYWTSLWVRNPRVPLDKVEVQSENHAEFFELRREVDGTLNDDGGFGAGEFTLRMTAIDGQSVTETFPSFTAGELVTGTIQFE
jgi:hypothetical protein